MTMIMMVTMMTMITIMINMIHHVLHTVSGDGDHGEHDDNNSFDNDDSPVLVRRSSCRGRGAPVVHLKQQLSCLWRQVARTRE